MGCDIHVWLERKIDDEWHMVSEASAGYGSDHESFGRERDYDFFAHLAGVRGDGPEPKGLPEDVSKVVKWISDGWAMDGHSHSWNSLKEWIDIKLALMRIRGDERSKGKGNDYEYWCWRLFGFEPQFEAESVKDYRVVYFFDN